MVPTDAVFGAQADLYKNATKILNKGGKITQTSKTVVLHNVMMRNIDDNVRKVNTMMLVLEKDADETDYYTERYESYKKVATLEDYDTGHTIEATEDEIAASNARFVLEATKAGNYHPQLVMQLQNSQHLSDSQIAQLMGNASAAGASLDGGGGDDGGGQCADDLQQLLVGERRWGDVSRRHGQHILPRLHRGGVGLGGGKEDARTDGAVGDTGARRGADERTFSGQGGIRLAPNS